MADATENDNAPDQPATAELGDAGKKALDAERREKRAAEKRAADLEARLKEFEDRDKTETTRASSARRLPRRPPPPLRRVPSVWRSHPRRDSPRPGQAPRRRDPRGAGGRRL
jgi:hypothetical protein